MKRVHQLSVILCVSLLISATAHGQGPETEPAEVIRIDANLVTIPAQVMDRSGRFIINLQREDFQIFEDGVEQEVSFFSPVDEPFSILFLMDVSGSMYVHLSELALAGNAFLSQLRSDDRFMAVSFCDQMNTLAELGPVRESRVKPLTLRVCGRGTFLYEAVNHALKRMKKIPGRRAIVLFSDGLSDQKGATAKSTLREAEEQQALIYSIQFGNLPLRPSTDANSRRFNKTIENAYDYMAGIAQKTGGRHYRLEDITDLKKTFGEVADELRRQYTLGYYPKIPLNQGQRRAIRVSVRRPDLAVRARDSYLAIPPARGKP